MTKNKTENIKGFTIIELLMTVAIIALLVAIVAISITIARTKAGNSVIKNDVDQLRKFAETMYADNELRGYCIASGGTSCFEFSNFKLSELKEDLKKRGKNGNTYPTILSNPPNATKFCIHAKLSDGDFYCMDSSSGQSTGSGASGAGTCSSMTLLCQ